MNELHVHVHVLVPVGAPIPVVWSPQNTQAPTLQRTRQQAQVHNKYRQDAWPAWAWACAGAGPVLPRNSVQHSTLEWWQLQQFPYLHDELSSGSLLHPGSADKPVRSGQPLLARRHHHMLHLRRRFTDFGGYSCDTVQMQCN